MLYADSSALVKLVVEERETRALKAVTNGRALLASELVVAEVPRAVRRAVAGEHAATRRRALAAADALLAELLLVLVDGSLLRAAGELEPPALRTLDAVHVVSALVAGDELEAFVTYDSRQREAAENLGLSVVAPAAPS